MTVCIESTKNKILVFSENKSRLEVHNSAQEDLERHKVDGCLVTKGVRCDWKLVQVLSQREAYIELKGGNIEHAVEQIVESVKALTSNAASNKVGYVICTRSPLASTAIQSLAKRVKRDFNIILRVKKTVCTVSVGEVFDFGG